MKEIGSTVLSYEYVSFDVFDTLIKRSVAQPSDLFRLLEVQYEKIDFAYERMQAERIVLERLKRPVTLAEIYAQMDEVYRPMMTFEIESEKEGCCANPLCTKLFQQCIDAGKNVVLISDMYLPSEVIADMLKKCGIIGYKKLYVSCENYARKRDGTLFHKVLNELRIRPRQLIHVGDNIKSDVIRPMTMGIRAVWVKNDQRQMCHIPRLMSTDFALMQRTIQVCIRNASIGLSDVEKYGCAIFGPLLYGFTAWLAKKLSVDEIKDVYFMAREGLIMKRAFDQLNISSVKTHYLYCSRRSYIVPVLWKDTSFGAVFQRVFISSKISLRDFISRVGLEPEKYEMLAKKYQIAMDKWYERKEFVSSCKVRNFYEEIQADVDKNSRKEYDTLLSYINSLKMEKEIAIVDIGYHGSMQSALVDLINTASLGISVKGYYVAIACDAPRFINDSLQGTGYLCDIDRNTRIFQEINEKLAFFEVPFMAKQGSVKRFVLWDGYAVPELYESEYMDNEISFIERIQNGGLAFLNYMLNVWNCLDNTYLELPSEVSFYAFNRLGMNPTLREARLWGDISFFNFNQVCWIARPKKLAFYFMHPGIFLDDINKTPWKIGFMKRLLRVPLPYSRIRRLLKCLVNLARKE